MDAPFRTDWAGGATPSRARRLAGRRARVGSVAEIHELEVDVEVPFADEGDRRLQLVAGLPRNAQLVPLNLRLHLELGVLDRLDDLLGRLRFDPLLVEG